MRISDWSSDVCSSDLATTALNVPPLAYQNHAQKCTISSKHGNERSMANSKRTATPHRSRIEAYTLKGGTAAVWRESNARSEERRVGKECVSTGRSGGSRYH